MPLHCAARGVHPAVSTTDKNSYRFWSQTLCWSSLRNVWCIMFFFLVNSAVWFPHVLPSVLWRCWLAGRKGIWPLKNMGGWWRWALVSPDGVAPSRMVGVSASVNLPLHRKVQKFSSGTGSPRWARKKGREMVVVWCGGQLGGVLASRMPLLCW